MRRPYFPSLLGVLLTALSVGLPPIAGCSSPAPYQGCLPGSSDPVKILISGTKHEPRPTLTPRAVRELRIAAAAEDATDGAGGQGSSAEIITGDGQPRSTIALTPRRADCAVEHGLQRPTLIEQNVTQVIDASHDTATNQPELDLLTGISNAVRASKAGLLIIDSNGLSTTGGLDIRQVGWEADPGDIVRQLRDHDLLPALAGWRVLWIGLAATAGDQAELPAPIRSKLQSYWAAICAAARASSCEFDDTPVNSTPPLATADMSVVEVPRINSVVGPRGNVLTTVPDALLGFGPDSATLSPAAVGIIRSMAAELQTELAARPNTTITLTGYTADPPGSTTDGRKQLSLARATVVANAISAAGVTNKIVTVGGGAAPGVTALQQGVFIEPVAAAMRRVEISY